jgi:hypothetical protein
MAAMAREMYTRFLDGDYQEAMALGERILTRYPADALALTIVNQSRDALAPLECDDERPTIPAPSGTCPVEKDEDITVESSAPCERRSVPVLCIGSGFQTLTRQERELLTLVDGASDLDTILASSDMPPEVARATMARLISAGIVQLRQIDTD